ncbi:MAG: hypothetical protein J5742_02705 [Alphaproteobacteria bacterium]|nr:hypothetical protein [Alphaproteobacteria bacterium]
MTNKLCSIGVILAAVAPFNANALGYKTDNFNFSLTGYGTAGIIEPNFDKPDFIGDFRVRGQVMYTPSDTHAFGLVYMIDEDAVYEDNWLHDAFGFWQWRGVGRIEAGFTDSVAHKLGLGLPDVGGMRINHDSLIYRKMGTGGPVIANNEITNGTDALRLNIVSASRNNIQYGVSVAGITGDYDFGVDAGIKIKQSSSKTKYAFSIGASFMNHLDDYETATFVPKVTADWRGQLAIGTNIQYNSWIFALNGRLIYDENPIDVAADGITAGAGISYDLLNYTLSLSYIFSETGIWHDEFKNHNDHTALASFRYKYSKYIDGWTSVGISRAEPFLAAGLRVTF